MKKFEIDAQVIVPAGSEAVLLKNGIFVKIADLDLSEMEETTPEIVDDTKPAEEEPKVPQKEPAKKTTKKTTAKKTTKKEEPKVVEKEPEVKEEVENTPERVEVGIADLEEGSIVFWKIGEPFELEEGDPDEFLAVVTAKKESSSTITVTLAVMAEGEPTDDEFDVTSTMTENKFFIEKVEA